MRAAGRACTGAIRGDARPHLYVCCVHARVLRVCAVPAPSLEEGGVGDVPQAVAVGGHRKHHEDPLHEAMQDLEAGGVAAMSIGGRWAVGTD